MTTFSEIERQLEPFDGPESEFPGYYSQLAGYDFCDLERDTGSLYWNFSPLDNKGPLEALGELAEQRSRAGQRVTVLDAGCGTGRQVTQLIVEAALRRGVAISCFLTDAVSDRDFSRYSRHWMVRHAIGAGLVNYVVGDLNTMALPADAYDLVYSYEVLMHNAKPERIVHNLWQALKPGGGVAYFNVAGEQVPRIDRQMKAYRSMGAEVLSGATDLPRLLGAPLGEERLTRHAYKITKPAA